METENKNPIQVADRLFGALEFLSQRKAAGLMEIARALSLNKSTTHRVLRSLICLGYVQKDGDTGQYRLTSKITDACNYSLPGCNLVIAASSPYYMQFSNVKVPGTFTGPQRLLPLPIKQIALQNLYFLREIMDNK